MSERVVTMLGCRTGHATGAGEEKADSHYATHRVNLEIPETGTMRERVTCPHCGRTLELNVASRRATPFVGPQLLGFGVVSGLVAGGFVAFVMEWPLVGIGVGLVFFLFGTVAWMMAGSLAPPEELITIDEATDQVIGTAETLADGSPVQEYQHALLWDHDESDDSEGTEGHADNELT